MLQFQIRLHRNQDTKQQHWRQMLHQYQCRNHYRFHHRYRYYGGLRIDDFVLTTNFYPGEDVPVTAAAAAAASLSTGGIQLFESTYNGDFHSVGDSINVVLENSAILVNEARDKDCHGLGLYADLVNLTT